MSIGPNVGLHVCRTCLYSHALLALVGNWKLPTTGSLEIYDIYLSQLSPHHRDLAQVRLEEPPVAVRLHQRIDLQVYGSWWDRWQLTWKRFEWNHYSATIIIFMIYLLYLKILIQICWPEKRVDKAKVIRFYCQWQKNWVFQILQTHNTMMAWMK